ncbi:MAG: ribonuclease P [uncultured bacterium]|nr:MAG: ribonuclease P [uncultured bacterium]KKT02908.1 MAG: ribonuclease P, ribonuclease P protein component [Candidatus Peregrinibacteria bacterium GW2011_GWF2_43_17]KKT20393.1 MAG: Ribonuclease P protein component [Candidatus Peregrinibacteria bacterium GW2011_GWA2_43_8]HAU40253.1 ribonuclease P protein component [Candidatus Peregrinibacteria bacterium]
MLPKRYKLTKRDGIKSILEEGEMIKTRYFVAKSIPDESGQSRFSILISAKISKKATIRNRLRRQIFEIIRLNIEEILKRGPRKTVILPRTSALSLTYQEIQKELLKTL